MSSIASVPNYENNYNNLATMSNRQSTTNYPPWPPATPTSDSHHMHHMSQSHTNSAHQSQAPTPTTVHHQDPSNITPPPTATTTSRSGTSSPPRATGMTPETRDRRLANQMRRDSKTVTRLKRANSNPYGADISSGPPSAGLTGSVYGSPQGPSTGGMPMLSESDPAPMQSPSYIQYSPSSIQGSGHYNGYQSPHLPPYAMPMSYDFNHPQQSPYSRHPPSNLPMDPSSMMYGTVPSMISPGMPPTPHGHGHPHVAHQQHPHPHHAVSPSHMGGPDNNVRVVQTRPKPQCWEHGCNGRQFSTFSNLLRHQREKSGQAAKATCPNCGAEFTRTTARNGHLLHDKCKKRNNTATSQGNNVASTNNTNSTTVVAQQGQQQAAPSE